MLEEEVNSQEEETKIEEITKEEVVEVFKTITQKDATIAEEQGTS